jgi:hypothetical protein
MEYNQIAKIAPRLRDYGFTHVQFPPIQPTRKLNILDIDILQQQIKACDKYLLDFELLCEKAREKAALYPHSFDFLLFQRIHYIRQPTLAYLHTLVYNGIPTKKVYDAIGPELSISPVANLLADIQSLGVMGSKHSSYALLQAAELILDYDNSIDMDMNLLEMEELQMKYDEIQMGLGKSKPPQDMLDASKIILKRLKQLRSFQHKIEKNTSILQRLETLKDSVESICNRLRNVDHTFQANALTPLNIKRWIDIVGICELLVYSPWWLIYQPLKLDIGDTFLGTTTDIIHAISACKEQSLEVIADIVVNNLAATPGERKAWESFRIGNAETLGSLVSEQKDMVLEKTRDLLRNAFESDDLHMLTPPYECKTGQEPTHCWMSGALPQLNQSHPRIQHYLQSFLSSLKSVGISGVRIDAAVHLTPSTCSYIVNQFGGISYIEYVGGSESWRKYSATMYSMRQEDFDIGPDLYKSIFSESSQFHRLPNIGSQTLKRHENIDSVVMIVNHDHMMGSIPSDVYSYLPSKETYELSVAYLVQRIYGCVLLMPHEVEFPHVQTALQLRKMMRQNGINREYVHQENSYQMLSYKYRDNELMFVCGVNAGNEPFDCSYGIVEPFSMSWWAMDPLEFQQLWNKGKR